jgi:hypothetical protein
MSCESRRTLRVVDEAGAPVAGARVRAVASGRACGPSGLPEGCVYGEDESPVVLTDASGTASVCDVVVARQRRAATHERRVAAERSSGSGGFAFGGGPLPHVSNGSERGWFIVERGDWPAANVPFDGASPVTIGPPRSVTVELPEGCSPTRVHVSAYAALDARRLVHARAGEIAMRAPRYRIEGLGPWQYSVVSEERRGDSRTSGGKQCAGFVRFVDARHVPSPIVLDHSETLVDLPAFSGGRVTLTAFGKTDVVLEATLDDQGHALLALPTTPGVPYCLHVQKDAACRMTYAGRGEVVKADAYAGREREIEANCGRCD